MAENMQRLFVAMETPAKVKQAMETLQGTLRAAGADVRWERPEKFHLTLKFLGDVRTDLVERIATTVHDALRAFPPFAVVYRGIGVFPPNGDPRVVWVGMLDDGGTLDGLHRTLEEQFVTLGFPKDDRRFHPHVTLGRVRTPVNVGALRRSVESLTFGSQPIIISSIDLIKSTLKSDGSSYATIARFPLPSTTR
jgi:RNA 2',3'-cyclic 3'-phosphodiesterase